MLSSREKQRKNKSRDQKSQKSQNKKEETSLSKKISDLAESAMRFFTKKKPKNLAITEQRGPERKFSLKRVNSLAKARQSICDQFQEQFNQHFISPN
ncbi:unnamed protein product [Oikopleura dioica]|uniref:Uncharacterized protein n=1 Tax=Oikopleura dioica TaxID=34765 RepID=E4WQQ7_OIKDI|nr:unnamed protein product [Oikopleura dioica]